ncbi:hypothetical protein M3Y97_00718300 [Aphelenchoides bicaudatus]|nr:hypothetical protein M3Y97_00718300 [Aphelenchoides bicaudatus]
MFDYCGLFCIGSRLGVLFGSGHLPYLSDVCHKFKFVKPPQCLKFTQGEIVTRDCDPSMLCERFNIRNRCVNSVKQASFLPNNLRIANLYGEICCCSTDLCNSTNRPFLHLLPTICSIFIVQLFFTNRFL